jgi:two-component system copper resistance phosphate regulon response regulator CusR
MGPSTIPQKQSSPLPASHVALSAKVHRVLIIEDDVPLSRFLSRELRLMQYVVDVSYDGESACEHIESSQYDLVILDLNLPNMDGFALLEKGRVTQRGCPILVLTARTSTEDRVRVLDYGAADCLIKPFSFQELQARIRSLLRRNTIAYPPAVPGNLTELILHREEYRVTRGQRRIELTPREFALLECLVHNVGKPVSRMVFMRDVWNIAFDSTSNIVDVYMKYLRDKIDGEGEPKLIRTVRGVGYELRNGH